MKLKYLVAALAALNLGCVYAAAFDGVPAFCETKQQRFLNAESLGEAYQDFLDYYHQNPKMQGLGIHPTILFARELQERDEGKLSLKILSDSSKIEPSMLSETDISAIHNVLRLVIIGAIDSPILVDILESSNPTPHQTWLKSLFFQVHPYHLGLLELAKETGSRDMAMRRQAVLGLFDLMVGDSDIAVKRRAAALVVNVWDQDFKSFLNDSQLEEARIILSEAINDSSIHSLDRYGFSGALLWTFNANHDGRLGSDEQRQEILNSLFDLALDPSLSDLTYVLPASIIGSRIFGTKFTFLAPQSQRKAALQMIVDGVISEKEGFFKLNEILLALSFAYEDPEGSEDKAGKYLASPEQRSVLLGSLHDYIANGRSWQKVQAASHWWIDGSEYPAILDFKNQAKDACLSALENSNLTPKEKLDAICVILSARLNLEGTYQRLSTDEERANALKKVVQMLELPNLKPWMKSKLISEIIRAKDSQVRHIASNNEIARAIDYGMGLFSDEEYDSTWLATEIFLEDKIQLSIEQSQILISYVLKNISLEYSDNYSKKTLAGRVINHTAATDEQRREALQVFVDSMNDASQDTDSRKSAARWVHETKDTSGAESLATAEQIAAAQGVLAL